MKKRKQQKGMGSLYKRDSTGKEVPVNSKKHGTYWIAYRDTSGKRIKRRLEVDGKSVTDYETAKKEQLRLRAPYLTGSRIEVLKAIEADIKRLEIQQAIEEDIANPPLSIADAWYAYVNSPNRKDCCKETLGNYSAVWSKFLCWITEKYPAVKYLREVTDVIAGEHMSAMRNNKWSANTYNKHLAFLKLIFKLLAKPARIVSNPFDDLAPKKIATHSRRDLTIEELHRVITTATGEMQMLFKVGTFTGFRMGDCCTLTWGDIDLVRGIIKRKPHKTIHSSGVEVTVGIPGVFLRELLAIPVEKRIGFLMPDIAARYSEQNSRKELCKLIQKHFRSCGIETRAPGTGSKWHYEGKKKIYDDTPRAVVLVGFHSLRHTYASIHAASGTPAPLIQENMGHSSPGMTEHYTHVSDDTARRVAAVFDLPQLISSDIDTVDNINKMRHQLFRIIETADAVLLQKLLRIAMDE